MKRGRNNRLIIGLLIFTLFLTGVYALLATNLNITGTARGAGDFKIEFSSFNVSDESKASANLDVNRTSLAIEADLSYPGDSVTIDFTIKNTGSLRAMVSDLVINENSNDDIEITISGLSSIKNTTLDTSETTNGTITIRWLTSSTNPNPENVSFDVTIDYIQAT